MADGTCTVPGCGKMGRLIRGLCSMHYSRMKRRGSLDAGRQHLTLPERFWPKVNKTDTCWLWAGARDVYGYGYFYVVNVPKQIQAKAHRLAYELTKGPIPDGLDLDHLCRVTLCVNPDHLEPVTRRENTRRGISPSAANAVKTSCHNGHPFDAANTYYVQGKPNHRMCRTCHRERQARYRSERLTRMNGGIRAKRSPAA